MCENMVGGEGGENVDGGSGVGFGTGDVGATGEDEEMVRDGFIV